MKPVSMLLAAFLGVAAVHARLDASSASGPVATVGPATSTGSNANANANANASAGNGAATSPLDSLKSTSHPGEWHMKPVRVVQARVQSDTPMLVKGRFVSSFGKGDLDAGYLSSLDTVNTASVEGALMFVQAECINVNARAVDERCVRKNKVNHIVFYEILIAQTNESIAEYQNTWNAPEYGPMVPMDKGRCTPLGDNKDGTPKFPPECLQYNGDDGQPNVGPVVGGGIKEDEPRAPYPGTYWFSFPNSCPLQPWGDQKSTSCRAKTRPGLCPIGEAPDGVKCTFAYDILGWVPIDDVVGITNLTNPNTNQPFVNFEQWCNSSKDNYEFKGDIATNKPDDGAKFLPFWEDPLDVSSNEARAAKVVQTYNMIVAKTFKSTQIDPKLIPYFKPLPDPATLRKSNPPCYQTVQKCNQGFGCARTNYSQLCVPCTSKADGCQTDSTYKFPTLVKAPRKVADSDLSSGSKLAGKGATSKRDNASAAVSVTFSAVLMALVAAVAFYVW